MLAEIEQPRRNFVGRLLAVVLVGVFLASGVGLMLHDIISTLAVAPPNIIPYQGRVLNSNGVPVAAASADMQFRLYDSLAAGTCLWSNASATCASNADLAVTLTDGLFSENLGDTGAGYAAIADSVFADDASVYLEVQVEGETLSPRKRLGASAYALNAGTLDGLNSADFLSATGDTATGDYDFTGAVLLGGSPLVLEGSSADGFETTISATDPTADNAVVMQNASGTIALLSDIPGGSGLWESGASATYEDDDDVVVGSSGDETLVNAGFSLSGNDLFVADLLGAEGSVYTDGSFIAGASLTMNDAGITDSNSDIDFSSTTDGFNFDTASGAGDDFAVDGTSLVVLGDTGRVGIGTAAPGETLEVTGTSYVSGHVAIGADAVVNDGSLLYPASTFSNTLNVSETSTDATVDYVEGITNYLVYDPSADASLVGVYGLDTEVYSDAANTEDIGGINGGYFNVQHEGSGTVSELQGLYVAAETYAGPATAAEGALIYGTNGTDTAGALIQGLKDGTFTTAGTLRGVRAIAQNTNAVTAGTDDTYGVVSEIIRAGATGGTINTYGYYLDVGVMDAAGAGTHTLYGLYLENVTGADTNYAIYSAGGQSYHAGNFGIGATSPDADLDIEAAEDTERVRLTDSSNADSVGLYVGDGTAGLDGTLSAQAGSLFLDEDGKLWVNMDGATNWDQVATTAGGALDLDGAYDNDADKELLVDSATGLIFDLTTTGDFVIQAANTTFATFNDSGNVSFENTVTLGSSSADLVLFNAEVDTSIVPNTDDTYALGSSLNRWSDVFVGPGSLHVGNNGDDSTISYSVGSDLLTFQNSADSATAFQFLDADGGTPILNVDGTNERVGIGDASPDAMLDVAGSFQNDGDVTLGDAATDNVVFNADVNSNVLPNTDDTYTLGDADQRWADIFLGPSTLYIGTSSTDEGTISYDTTGNVFNFATDATTNGDIAFFTDDLYLDKSAGNVGIGSASPDADLDIEAAEDTERVRLTDSTNADSAGLYVGDGTAGLDGTLSAQAGSLFLDVDGRLWVNVDGATDWTDLTAAGGSGDITAVGSMTSGDAFADATASGDWLGLGAAAGRIEFDDQATDEVNILSSRVGIGTSTPTRQLDVYANADGILHAMFDNDSVGTSAFTAVELESGATTVGMYSANVNFATFPSWADKGVIYANPAASALVLAADSGQIQFATGSTDVDAYRRMTISLGGNVGIGDDTPDDLLNLYSATQTAIAITSVGVDTDPFIKFELSDTVPSFTIGVDDSDSDKFKVSTTALGTGDRLVIDSSGNVGVGDASPTNLLDVAGAIGISDTTVISSGRELQNIAGYTQSSGDFAATLTTTNDATFASTTASSDTISIKPQTTTATATFDGQITSANLSAARTWTFQDASGTVAFTSDIPAAGANTALSNLASVAINTSLISDTNNTDDLGSSGIGWKDLYLAGNATVGGDVAVNGGDVTTTGATGNLFNATASTVNVGGAASTISIGPSGATATSIQLGGGGTDTSCVVQGATGNLDCDGTITGANGSFGALAASGVLTLGDGGDTIAINSSDWDISSTGAMTGIDSIGSTGAIDLTPASGSNLNVQTGSTGDFNVINSTNGTVFVIDETGVGVFDQDIFVGNASSTDDDSVNFDAGGVEYVRWDDAGAEFEVSDDWNILGNCLESGVACDLAETFFADAGEALEEYDVVVNDASGTKKVKKSSVAYDPGLMGAVSLQPAILMEGSYVVVGNDDPVVDPERPAVVLSGVVRVKVSEENGVPAIGDMLTTSAVAGHAMRATQPGMVLGRVVGGYASTGPGTGTVLVDVKVGWHSGGVIATDGTVTTLNGDVAMSATGTATSGTPGMDSFGLSLRGSGWDGAAAQERAMKLVTDVTDAATYKLSVRNQADTEVAYITDDGVMSVASDMVVGGKLYPSALGVAQTDKYIFYGGAGDDFMRTNATGWGTGSYDFAEMFPSSQPLEPGDVVAFDTVSQQVKKASGDDRARLAGIVSTRPGFLAGDKKEGDSPIALAGRVPTKVTAENGDIAIGDALTVSETQPGYAMKATEAGIIIGYALEPFPPTAPTAPSTIITFVHLGYWTDGTQPTAGTDNAASGFSPSNVSSLSMNGNVYMQGNSILDVGAIAGLGGIWSVDAEGTFRTEGTFKTVIESYQGDQVETAAVTSPDVQVTLIGTATLENGIATVSFESVSPSFNDITSTTAPVRVLVTPSGPVSLYVEQKDHNGFTVRQVGGVDSGIAFDWMVSAYRKDFEAVGAVGAVGEDVTPIEEAPTIVEPPAEAPIVIEVPPTDPTAPLSPDEPSPPTAPTAPTDSTAPIPPPADEPPVTTETPSEPAP